VSGGKIRSPKLEIREKSEIRRGRGFKREWTRIPEEHRTLNIELRTSNGTLEIPALRLGGLCGFALIRSLFAFVVGDTGPGHVDGGDGTGYDAEFFTGTEAGASENRNPAFHNPELEAANFYATPAASAARYVYNGQPFHRDSHNSQRRRS
jgi:hypothetical protein